MAAWGIVPCHHGRTLVRLYPCLPRLQVVLRGRRGFRTTPNATCRGGRPRPPSLVAIFTPGGISSRTHASRSSPLKPAVNSFLSKRAGRRRGLGSPPVCELRRHHRQPARDVKSSPIFLCRRRCGPTYARARTRTPYEPGRTVSLRTAYARTDPLSSRCTPSFNTPAVASRGRTRELSGVGADQRTPGPAFASLRTQANDFLTGCER
jgi:hypothetical protein